MSLIIACLFPGLLVELATVAMPGLHEACEHCCQNHFFSRLARFRRSGEHQPLFVLPSDTHLSG